MVLDKMSISNFKKIGDNYAIFVMMSGRGMEEANTDIVKELMGREKSCLYVTVNQPYTRMLQIMEKNGVDTGRVFFIDCITKTSGGEAVDSGNCVYLDSPGNLTDLSISITEALKSLKGGKVLFMDALSTLVIYSNPSAFAKFAHMVMTKVKSSGITGIFIIVEGEIEEDVFSQIEQFSDTVIDLR